MIADAAKSERARNIVLRGRTELAFTGPLGLVACTKCFLAVFLPIFSVQRRHLRSGGWRRSACRYREMLLRKQRVGDGEKYGNLRDSDVRFGWKSPSFRDISLSLS